MRMSEQCRDLASRHSRLSIKHYLSLCARCENGIVVKRKSQSEPHVLCGVFEKWVPDDIESCTRYRAAGSVDIWTLARMAKLIDPDTKERLAGFQPQKEEP